MVETAAHFVDAVLCHHELPKNIFSDRKSQFTSAIWTTLLELLDTKLPMATAIHPETDGQTERVIEFLNDGIRSYATSFYELNCIPTTC